MVLSKQIKLIVRVLSQDLTYMFSRKLPILFRISYPVRKYWALAVSLLYKSNRNIQYLGNRFYYDYLITPFSLQAYPYEVIYNIKAPIKEDIRTILDIGGNLGQFAVTAKYVWPDAKIFVFEPYDKAFQLLKKNTTGIEGISIYNYGVGEAGERDIYVVADRTSTASIFMDNAKSSPIVRPGEVEKHESSFINDVVMLCGTSQYDLVKVDVEGAEYEVVEALANIKIKYLYIELSSSRSKSYFSSDIFQLLEHNWGSYEVVFQESTGIGSAAFNVLIYFNESPTK